ncbi:unnamed protein product [Ranitomeya imitator]|uniref:Uncharacterized protein n=1 Tax=Ranitomeya imitator TaxID=111125 RepID=A0ABN9LLD4_9NEOB|nr:unnamed protein product [Ranitomeya imitator]
MLSARKASSASIYHRVWKTFFSWCRLRGHPLLVFSIPCILNFLQSGLDSGLALSSLKGQISALSVLFQRRIAANLQVKTFIQGVSHVVPPYRMPLETWDLNLVLGVLQEPPFKPLQDVPLSVLSWKVAFLVACQPPSDSSITHGPVSANETLGEKDFTGGTSQIGDLTVCTALCQITDLTYSAAGLPSACSEQALNKPPPSLPAGPGCRGHLGSGPGAGREAKEKEERLLRRRLKRERLEERRKQKALERSKTSKMKTHGGTSAPDKPSKDLKPKPSSLKEVLKEQMFLEKKVAMSRKKKSELRTDLTSGLKIKGELHDEDSRDTQKSNESLDRFSSSTREPKSNTTRIDPNKASRKLLESTEQSKNDSRGEKEFKKKTFLEKMQDVETADARKHMERLDSASEDYPKSKNISRPEKHSKRDGNDGESQNAKSMPKKELKSFKGERERTFSEERSSSKHRHKLDSLHRQATDDSDSQKSKRTSKDEEQPSKHSQSKSSSEERTDRKNKQKIDGKSSLSSKDERSSDHIDKVDSSKRERHQSTEKSRPENRNKRSGSDSRQHRELKRSHSSSEKKPKLLADEKNEVDSANSDNSRQEESIKDRKKIHGSSEEKSQAKAKFKSSGKLPKPSDQEEVSQKSEREKPTEKSRRSKSEDKEDERRENATGQNSSNAAKDAIQKFKHSDKLKERARLDSKDRDTLKSDKKYTEVSRSKQGHKDERRKSESGKVEERFPKYLEDKRTQDRASSSDRKSNKKSVSEHRSESFKGVSSKKGNKSESESDSQSLTMIGESKDVARPREDKKSGRLNVESTERANIESPESISNLGNASPHFTC